MSQKNIWLKIAKIKGEGTHEGFADQIQLESYSFGASNAMAGSNRQAAGQIRGQVLPTDFSVSAATGLHSAPLFKALCSNENLAAVVMTKLTSAEKPTPFLIVTMTNCFVSNFHSADTGGSGTPGMESISFNYEKIHFKYFLIGSDNKVKGNNEATYDAAKGKTS